MKPTNVSNRRVIIICSSALAAILLMVWSIALSSAYSEEQSDKFWAKYYPLAIGNSWKYSVIGQSGKTEPQYVVWKVANSSANSAGPIFAVWQTPSDADDTGMQLQFTTEGLRELSGGFFLLRFPLKKGGTWSGPGQERVFTVVNEGERCTVGKLNFDVCAVVQDDDREAKLRTITTCGLGIGPVRYEYHKLVDGAVQPEMTQALNLISYSVK